MKIENIRLGLATNSSSTHSIIFNLDSQSEDWEDAEFGWNEFCCNDKDSKQMYLAATLFQNLQHQIGDTLALAVVKAWTSIDLPTSSGYVYGVDHQSLMDLPVNKEGHVDKEFFEELMQQYMNPDIAIVGGNDNEDFIKFKRGRKPHLIETDKRHGTCVCRKDPNTGHWVLFNQSNGTKIRLHFDNDAPNYTKAFAPELIDVCITSMCDQNCQYCYMDSKSDGKHASMDFLQNLVCNLRRMSVFEVALGGGETTVHPEFPRILKRFRESGIVPNFTTRSYKWLHDDKIREAVQKYAGKFAISITHHNEMERAFHFADELKMASHNHYYSQGFGCRLGFQYVMGTTTLEEFRNIIDNIPYGKELTLLGYKEVGRGASWKPYDYSGWLDVIKSSKRRGLIGIDTSLATQFRQEVLELVDKRFVTFEEGKFSMYVDAVNKKAAISSYCDPKDHVDIDSRCTNLQEIFSAF